MGTVREVDAIGNAIIETEREIAGSAWDQEDTELDQGGDRSMEEMGDGLEGQHEAEDDTDAEGEEAEGEEESEADGETAEAEAAAAAAAPAETGKGKDGEVLPPQPEGRVPAGKLREANERARAAETERDTFKGKIDEVTRTFTERLDQAMRRIDDLTRAPRAEPAAPVVAEPKTTPDIFEDPKGFVDHLTGMFQSELSKRDVKLEANRVETSMAIAHAFHKDTFAEAFAEINKLDPRNPDDRAAVQRIYNSPNPGEALVSWHKRSKTLAEVGDDPTAFRDRVREETRQALLKDPEFRNQMVAELRGEAARPGPDGNPRTTTRLPPALNRASGSNLGTGRDDTRGDDSEQAVADAAWR